MNELIQRFQLRNEIRNKLLFWFLFIIWCLEFFGHIYYLDTHFGNFINADFVGDAVFAKHLADTGNWILSSDWLPTTELYVVHHQLIMTPLFYFISDYKTVWLITSVIAYVLLSLSIAFFMRSFRANKEQSLLAIVLFFNPLCKIYLEFNIYFHGYLFYFILGFLIIGLMGRTLLKNELTTKYMIFLSVTSFLAGLCGIRMFTVVFVPLVITFVVMHYNTPVCKLDSLYLKVLGLMLVSSISGAGLHFLLGRYYVNASTKNFPLQDLECVIANISVFPKIILKSLFRVSESKLCIIGSMIFWIGCFFGIYRFRTANVMNEYAKLYRLLKIFLIIGLIVNSVLPMLFFPIGDFSFGLLFYGERFLALSGFFLIPLFILILKFYEKEQTVGKICSIIVINLFLICGGYEYREMMRTHTLFVWWLDDSIKFLVNNNLKFGMSTYWNANTIMFLSQNKIEIVPVLDKNSLEIWKWNTRKSYEARKPQFLLLSSEEFKDRKKVKKDDVILYKDAFVVILKL